MKKVFLVVLCLLLAGCGTTAVIEEGPPEQVALTGISQGIDQTVFTLDSGDKLLLAKGSDLLLLETDSYLRFRDAVLMEQKDFSWPDEMQGRPLFQDESTFFYCTDQALWVMDLDTGSSRMLRQLSGGNPTLVSCTADAVQCCIGAHYLTISTANGAILSNSTDPVPIGFSQQTYGNTNCLLVQETMLPLPIGFHLVGFLNNRNQAVIAGKDLLRLYDLTNGSCLAETDSCGLHPSLAAATEDGIIWLLDNEKSLLIRWDPSQSRVPDCVLPVTAYYTAEAPDTEGLRQCWETAREIGEKYGFQFNIWTDAVKSAPWDYQFTPEYLVPVIQDAISVIDAALSKFPPGFLNNLASDAQNANLCLVRQIQGLTNSPALEIASGLQFWEGSDSYLVLCSGPDLERALYHELCHMIDSRILSRTHAYDNWDSMNPPGFSYGTAASLQDGFADDYAMSSPFEDRARILECAMSEGMDTLFQSERLQTKLRTICAAIRKAFALEKSTAVLPWEQYLH